MSEAPSYREKRVVTGHSLESCLCSPHLFSSLFRSVLCVSRLISYLFSRIVSLVACRLSLPFSSLSLPFPSLSFPSSPPVMDNGQQQKGGKQGRGEGGGGRRETRPCKSEMYPRSFRAAADSKTSHQRERERERAEFFFFFFVKM